MSTKDGVCCYKLFYAAAARDLRRVMQVAAVRDGDDVAAGCLCDAVDDGPRLSVESIYLNT